MKTSHRRGGRTDGYPSFRTGDRHHDGTPDVRLNNGYPPPDDKPWRHIDKSMHGWGDIGELSGKHVGAGIGNDFTDGHRGMARAVKGAKKFVRSRIRFHENAATRKLASSMDGKDA